MPQMRTLLATGGAIGGAYYLYMKYGFRTPGVNQMEDRFTARGGTPTHTPAVATKLGDPKNVEARHDNPKGPDSDFHKEKFSDQKKEPEVWGKKFYETQYGNEKGKPS